MKINGTEIKDCNTEYLYRALRSNRIFIKLYPWCLVFAFGMGIMILWWGISFDEINALSLFMSGLMFLLGIWSICSISNAKKINAEIVAVLDERNVTKEQTNAIDKKDKKSATDFLFDVIFVVVVLLVLLFVFRSCRNNDNKYEDVFNKDPNTWTEEEEDYVNNLYEFVVENDDDK